MSIFQLRIAGGLALSTALAIAPAAAAPHVAIADDTGVVMRRVTYVDADLRSPPAAERLAERVRWAAMSVCGGDSNLVRSGARFDHCWKAAADRAVAGLDAPLLAAALRRSPAELARR